MGLSAITSIDAWGTLPGWLTLISVLAVAWVLMRGGTGTAVSGLQDTNRELQRQIHVLQEDVKRLTAENARLRGRTDVSVAIEPIAHAMTLHEENAQKRSESTLTVLDLIAQRLGKEYTDDHQAGV